MPATSVFRLKASSTSFLWPSSFLHRRSPRSKPGPKGRTSRSQQPRQLRQRKRRRERKQLKPINSGPGFVRGRFVSRHSAQIAPGDTPSVPPGPSSRLAAVSRSPTTRQRTFRTLGNIGRPFAPVGRLERGSHRNTYFEGTVLQVQRYVEPTGHGVDRGFLRAAWH